MTSVVATFRITYAVVAEVRSDLEQMAKGGLFVKVTDVADLGLDAPVALELVMPDGAGLTAEGRVLHVFPAMGVAISVGPDLIAAVRGHATGRDHGGGPARHERVVEASAPRARPTTTSPAATAATAAAPETLSNAEKIQLALHGNRDQRNAILRDPNRTLHPFVLKNPALTIEDILAIAKNALTTPELLKQIAERKEWFQRPQVALALVRNPKTPQDLGIRALDYVPPDTLRAFAKGTGAMPHIVQAARRKVVK